jgi:hypothetical protein
MSSKYQQLYNKLKINDNIQISAIIDIPDEELSDDKPITITDIEKILLEDCSWYEREVFTRYVYNNKSFETMYKETGIPASSLFKTYNKVKKILKQKLYL